jgi:hypothetical protein
MPAFSSTISKGCGDQKNLQPVKLELQSTALGPH